MPKRPRRPDPLDEDMELLAPEEPEPADDGPEPVGSVIEDEPEPPEEEPEGELEEPPGSELEPEPEDDPGPELDPGDEDEEPEGSELDEEDEPTEEELDWPAEEEDEEDEGSWDTQIFPDPELTDDDWAQLSVERFEAPLGRVLVGFQEHVALPQLGLDQVVATFDTGEVGSRLCLPQVEARGDTHLSIGLDDQVVELALVRPGVVELEVVLAGSTRSLMVEVVAHPGPPELLLGREAMAGQVVVDVAQRFLHGENTPAER